SLDGRLDFRRVMRIIIDDKNAVQIAQHLEPPFGAPELCYRISDLSEGQPRLQTSDHAGKRIKNIVLARHGQLNTSQLNSSFVHAKDQQSVAERNVCDVIIRTLIHAIGNRIDLYTRDHLGQIRIVVTNNRFTAPLDLEQEDRIRLLQVVEIPVIIF